MPKLASLKPSTPQVVTAVFSVINVFTNLALLFLLVTGGIAVRSVYVDVVTHVTPETYANAQKMFGDATYFVHQARLSFESNNGSLPFNLTDITVATTYAMDGITAALMSIDRDAIHNATSTLGQPETQRFISTSIQRVLEDVERLQFYIDSVASLLNRISVSPTSFLASLMAPPPSGVH